MALKTITVMSGGNVPSEGWHEVIINKAKYGTYEGTQFIDIWFNDFPENMNARVYAKKNSKTNEEFAIANVFRYANAGIVDVLNDPTGKKPVISYDDDAKHLAGKPVRVYVYKENWTDTKYTRVLPKIVPIVSTNGEKITHTQNDVTFQETSAMKYFQDYVKKEPLNGFSTHDAEATVDEIKEMVKEIPQETAQAATSETDDLPF